MQKVTESVLNLNEILTSLKETIHMKAQGEKKKKGKEQKGHFPNLMQWDGKWWLDIRRGTEKHEPDEMSFYKIIDPED